MLHANFKFPYKQGGTVASYTYGFLYNWYVLANIAPTGWHVPTITERTTLKSYLQSNGYTYDDSGAINKDAKAVATAALWTSSAVAGSVGNTDYPAKRNLAGLYILPTGVRSNTGSDINMESSCGIWALNGTSSYQITLSYNSAILAANTLGKTYGMSVRLIKDDSTLATVTIDNYTYKTVKIGNQVWTAENLKTTKYNDGSAISLVTDATAWAALTTGAYCIYNNASAPNTYTP